MKLYLSSLRIPDTKAYLKLFGWRSKKHVAIIPTAWNTTPDERAQPYIDATTKLFVDLGFTYEYIDLKNYTPEQLAPKLKEFGAIWVMGGNTFVLNYWMSKSGFDKLLPALLKKGVVYGGESAGAVIAGKTLHGIELLDNPAEATDTIWPGLGLVPYGIIPHWNNQADQHISEQAFEEMRLFSPVKTLTDQDFITIS